MVLECPMHRLPQGQIPYCKNKILSNFEKWDEKYEEDERGPLVAGIRECKDAELINLLINVQRLASGYEQIKELMDAAEQKDVDEAMSDDEDDDSDVVKKIDEVKIVEYVNENFGFVTDEDKETIIKQFKIIHKKTPI